MARLDKPWRRYLSKEDFEQYPLWVWDDENEGHLPISDSEYTGEYGTLFIKAKFKTNHHEFDGYLVGFDKFYCFELFINNDTFGFNVNMSSFAERTLNGIFKALESKPFPFFPLRYHSDITYSDGGKISGVFEFKDGKLSCTPDGWEERWKKIKAELEKKYGKLN